MMKANLLSAETLAFRDYIEIESARHLHTTSVSAFAHDEPGRSE